MKNSRERHLETLEAEYLTKLILALKQCANGRWGLFGQNDRAHETLGRYARERLSSPEAAELLALGDEIQNLRNKLGFAEPFPLHERLLQMRSSHDPNSQGEPKLARQWLGELHT